MNWHKFGASSFKSGVVLVLAVFFALTSGEDAQAATKTKKHRVTSRSKSRKKKAPPKPAAPPKPKGTGPAAPISLAKQYLEAGNLPAALEQANVGAVKVPQLTDYAHYYRAQAEFQLKNYAEVNRSVTAILSQPLISPLMGAAAALGVSAHLETANPKQAFELVKKYYEKIPQPQSSFLLARCLLANSDLPQATEYFQRVYYNYPNSKEAVDAATALTDLRRRLADGYPPVMPAAILGRVGKMFQARRFADAKAEITEVIPRLAGVQRDQARVRLGEADFQSGKISEAFEYFKTLQVDDSEADAERQAYLVRCARRLDKKSDVKQFLDELARSHPSSEWRMDALINVADQARAENDSATYIPLYRACAASFKNDQAAWCAWRAAFDAYRVEQKDAWDLLLSYIKQYPTSNDASNAVYFLGKLAERNKNLPAARACYEILLERLPNSYYATLARSRMKVLALQAAPADLALANSLKSVAWPDRPQFPSFAPGPVVQKRVVRAQMLLASGLHDQAEDELKFGSRNEDGQSNVYAYELAKFASAHGAPDEALRYIKAFAPGYLYMPLDQAPLDFWRLAFPLPFRASIEKYSRQQSLDPFLVAALIRQESEFNTHSISRANAYGLMQILPGTGKGLARHFGIRRFNSAQLFTPDRNIQLGTYFFRTLLDSNDNHPEFALAAYNAGPSRSTLWRTWGPFEEAADFAEIVPFHETRGYIQIVLRNADVYRRLYAGTHADVPPYRPKPAPSQTVNKKSKKPRITIHRRRRRR